MINIDHLQKLKGKDYKIIFAKKYKRKNSYCSLLHERLLDYVDIVSVEEKLWEISIYLKEKNNINPKRY